MAELGTQLVAGHVELLLEELCKQVLRLVMCTVLSYALFWLEVEVELNHWKSGYHGGGGITNV